MTVTIENLTGESYEDDDLSGMPELVEVIKLQSTGPSEAARALRKKLKYGNVHRQIRALVILDGLIQNAGSRFQRSFVDEPLLERLRVCGTSHLSDPDVKDKCRELFRQWAQYQNTPGLQGIARLHKVSRHIDLKKLFVKKRLNIFRNFPKERSQSPRIGQRFYEKPRKTPLTMMRKKRLLTSIRDPRRQEVGHPAHPPAMVVLQEVCRD